MGAQFDLNALSGINASSQGLAVIANNLANAETVGFKSSRTEFGDLFSGAQSSPGNGVQVASITQDFQQGTINGTGRDLDMAIDGEGFFIVEDRTGKYDNVYTRNGSFKLDENGFLTTQAGDKVQGYLLNETLSTESMPVFETNLQGIDLDELNKQPRSTDEMAFDINLKGDAVDNTDPNNGDSVGIATNLKGLVDPENTGAYAGFPDFSNYKTIHDSLGGEHRLTYNFYKRDVVEAKDAAGAVVSDLDVDGDGTNDKYTSWLVQMTVQDYDQTTGDWVTSGHQYDSATGLAAVDGAGNTMAGQVYELRFDTNGGLVDVRAPADRTTPASTVSGTSNDGTPLDPTNWTTLSATNVDMNWIIDSPTTGATDPLGGADSTGTNININLDFSDMSQFAGSYNLRGVSQNGFGIGDLVGINTNQDGVIEARYSNGRSIPVAQLGIANFADKNAMEKLGGQTYAETFGSGTVQLGKPQENGFGSINAGSLEYSNVDTASELVRMIQTQRTYQASAQVITTSQTLMQRVLQL